MEKILHPSIWEVLVYYLKAKDLRCLSKINKRFHLFFNKYDAFWRVIFMRDFNERYNLCCPNIYKIHLQKTFKELYKGFEKDYVVIKLTKALKEELDVAMDFSFDVVPEDINKWILERISLGEEIFPETGIIFDNYEMFYKGEYVIWDGKNIKHEFDFSSPYYE